MALFRAVEHGVAGEQSRPRRGGNRGGEVSVAAACEGGPRGGGDAGGGEDDETPLQAAIREAQEEAAIPSNEKWIKLDSVESIPAHIFTARAEWGTKTLVIPQYSFGVEMNVEVVISHEHTEFGWFDYETALQRMRYDGDKTAMWELNQRLKFGIL